jgi:hypothetical protein
MPIVSRLLRAIHSHRFWGWLALLAYAAAVTFPHENVQWLMNEIAIRISHHRLYLLSAEIGVIEVLLLTLIVVWRLKSRETRFALVSFWILTLALIAFTRWAFTANDLELVHYPQYVPEGVALVALTASAPESLAWIVILGGLDEAFQYAVLSRFRPAPYDFNDVFMDLLGGALGVLLGMLFLRCTRRDPSEPPDPPLWKRPGIAAILGILATGILLWASGLMLLFEDKTDTRYWFSLSRFRAPTFWFQVPTNGPDRYHTLSPIEGPILILATIALYAFLVRRVRIASPK